MCGPVLDFEWEGFWVDAWGFWGDGFGVWVRVRMSMNGESKRSGSIRCGETREEGIRVHTGPRATIFATHVIGKKTANQNKSSQTSRKNRNRT